MSAERYVLGRRSSLEPSDGRALAQESLSGSALCILESGIGCGLLESGRAATGGGG